MREYRHALVACLALLLACACSPEAETSLENRTQTTPELVEQKAPEQRNESVAGNSAVSVANRGPVTERRCGWLENPTPANWWLTDRDGQWVLGTQGSEQALGMEDLPDMTGDEWVETNGSYGYGCACLKMVTDRGTGKVVRVISAEPKPLAQCRADRALREPSD